MVIDVLNDGSVDAGEGAGGSLELADFFLIIVFEIVDQDPVTTVLV